MNCVMISGRVTREPEMYHTQSGSDVISFTVAVHRPMTKDVTDYVDCVAWDDRASFVERNFHKGMYVEVKGVITTRDYEKNGVKRKVSEIRVEDANMCPTAQR